jgi:hypothetical protein
MIGLQMSDSAFGLVLCIAAIAATLWFIGIWVYAIGSFRRHRLTAARLDGGRPQGSR